MQKWTSHIQFCPLINSFNWVYTNWNMTCSLTKPKKVATKLTTNRFTLNQISHQNIHNSTTNEKKGCSYMPSDFIGFWMKTYIILQQNKMCFLYVKWFH